MKKSFSQLRIAFTLLLIIFVLGVIGFISIEGYTFVEAFFMTIITISTVGFREVHSLSEIGQIFTAFLIIFSFGTFAYTITTITHYILTGELRNYLINYKINKKIRKIENHVIICGYGRNGSQASIELLDENIPFIIIEENTTIINELRINRNLLYIQGNATKEEILSLAYIKSAKALLTTLPSDADNLFVVLTARGINPNIKIISRASDEGSDKKLIRAGANRVVMPDRIGGKQMARLVAQPDIVEFVDYILLQSYMDIKLEEISCKEINKCYVDKTIRDLDIRNVSGANIIGVKDENGKYIYNPSTEVKMSGKIKIFALGTPQQIDNLKLILRN
ncbi:MAG: potassium channel protein [Bacteroidales bacterium]|nr:potassium channel protein [Bacteroidales bacterium]